MAAEMSLPGWWSGQRDSTSWLCHCWKHHGAGRNRRFPKLSLINVWDCLRHMLGEIRATGPMYLSWLCPHAAQPGPRVKPGQLCSPGHSRILEGGMLPVDRKRKKVMLTGLGICTALCLGSSGLVCFGSLWPEQWQEQRGS